MSKKVLLLFLVLLGLNQGVAHATVISPSEAIKLNFTFSGPPASDVDGLLVAFFAGISPPTPVLSPTATFFATMSNGQSELGTSTGQILANLDPNFRIFRFFSTTSPETTSGSSTFDFQPVLDGTLNGSVLIRSDGAFDFELVSLFRSFEIDFTRHDPVYGDVMANSPNYPYPVSYEIVELNSTVPEPNSIALAAIAAIAGLFVRRPKAGARCLS